MKLLKLIAVLLDYPAEELWAHGDELRIATGAAVMISLRCPA